MTRVKAADERAEHLRLGQQAEDAAKAYLERHGLRCLERNFRTRFGEIDLVMDDRGTRVFVEVRYRRSRRCGGALESVDSRKQGRLRAAAQWYLGLHPKVTAARFDVIAVEPGPDRTPDFIWVKNAIEDT